MKRWNREKGQKYSSIFLTVCFIAIPVVLSFFTIRALFMAKYSISDTELVGEINQLIEMHTEEITTVQDLIQVLHENDCDILKQELEQPDSVIYYSVSQKTAEIEFADKIISEKRYFTNATTTVIDGLPLIEWLDQYNRVFYVLTYTDAYREAFSGMYAGDLQIAFSERSLESAYIDAYSQSVTFYSNRADSALYRYKKGEMAWEKQIIDLSDGTARSLALLDQHLVVTEGTETIPNKQFQGTLFSFLSFPQSLRTIEAEAFADCDNIGEVQFPAQLEEIAENAFYGCLGLGKIVLLNSEIRVAASAFSECKNLGVLLFVGSEEQLKAWNLQLSSFSYRQFLYEGKATISQWGRYTTLNLDYYTYVGDVGYRTSHTISYTHNGYVTKKIADYSELYPVLNHKYYVATVKLGDFIQSVGSYAFYHTGISTITFSKIVDHIGIGAVSGCSRLQEIIVEADNETYASVDGVLYELYEDGTAMLLSFPAGRDGIYTVPAAISWGDLTYTVTTLAESAFACAYRLEEVVVPESVKEIGDFCFRDCYSLKTVTCLGGEVLFGADVYERCGALEAK